MAIRVVQVGLGPIGVAVVRQIVTRQGFELAAAIDLDAEKIGRDAGELCLLDPHRLDITVERELNAETAARSDLAVVCTSSSLAAFVPLAEALLARGLPIVSTTEELAFPFRACPELASRLDATATAAGVAVLGTGVNPGFAMDTLAMAITAPCERVDRITVERLQDAALRRIPFQQKVGAGLRPERFRELVAEGKMGHVGFAQSIAMIAAAVGWQLERITDSIEPRIAERPLTCGLGSIAAGEVAGILQHSVGYRNGSEVIRLHMEAYVGATESYDAVRVEGSPDLHCKIPGGIPGDVATASLTVNSIPQLLGARPGLRTMADLPTPRWWSGI